MSVYERLKEERNDRKAGKKKAKSSPRPQIYSKFAEARRKRYTLWRYYRAAARVRKGIQTREALDAAKKNLEGSGSGFQPGG